MFGENSSMHATDTVETTPRMDTSTDTWTDDMKHNAYGIKTQYSKVNRVIWPQLKQVDYV